MSVTCPRGDVEVAVSQRDPFDFSIVASLGEALHTQPQLTPTLL